MNEYDLDEDQPIEDPDNVRASAEQELLSSPPKRTKWVVLGVVIVLAAAFLLWPSGKSTPTMASLGLGGVSGIVKELQHRSPTTHPKAYVVDASAPLPTNKWFSGLVFAKPSNPVFAYPLSYVVTNSSAELSYQPPQTASSSVVIAPHTPAVTLSLASDTSLMKSYDDLSVVESFQKAGKEVATLRMTEGSPYMFGTIAAGQHAQVATTGGQVQSVAANELLIKVGNQTYGVWASNGASLKANGTSNLTLDSSAAATFAVFVLPNGAKASGYFAAASAPITATTVSYQTLKDGSTTTTMKLSTANGAPTIFGLQPWEISGEKNASGTLLGIEGEQTFFSGNAFSYTLSGMPQTDLSLGNLTASDKKAAIAQLKTDMANTTFATDSYNGGKTLYRAAELVNLAYQLGQTDEAEAMQARVVNEFNQWFNPLGYKTQSDKYFYYDDVIKGIVGVQPSYGSDEFNDHQFHYGYMIYAASIIAQHDSAFAKQYAPMVSTLISDIASPTATQYFPKLRVFDQYLGHSWADGYGQFADGANQESSSEAVMAWAGIYRWGKVTGNTSLQNEGLWLYQQETHSALTQNLNIDLSQPQYAGYDHDVVANLWSNELVYATWFSPSPAAMLGIELVPMSPAHTYVGDNKARVLQNLAAMNKELNGTRPPQFNDYFAMYEALADPQAARKAVAQLQPNDIDNGDSLTYVMAWVDSLADK